MDPTFKGFISGSLFEFCKPHGRSVPSRYCKVLCLETLW